MHGLVVAKLAVLGVGTGVGKTQVSTSILRSLLGRRAVAPFKPVESGTDENGGVPADALALLSASGLSVPLSSVCPWPLPRPLAPAAELERLGIELPMASFLAAGEALASYAPNLLFEGAGGVLSPITWAIDALEISASLGAEVLLVARDELGAMSALRTAMESIDRRGLKLRGVVLNRWADERSVPPGDNASALARWTSSPVYRASIEGVEAALVEALAHYFEP